MSKPKDILIGLMCATMLGVVWAKPIRAGGGLDQMAREEVSSVSANLEDDTSQVDEVSLWEKVKGLPYKRSFWAGVLVGLNLSLLSGLGLVVVKISKMK